MELQKLLKKTVAFRFNKRNNRETDPESVNYTNEIQLLSPSKSNFSHSELGIIPFNLGKSEKFENKQQITNALKGLNMIKEFSKESYFRSKTKIQKSKELKISPINIDHLFHKKNISPYSPGVVRIMSKEKLDKTGFDNSILGSPIKKTAQFSTPRVFSTPQPISLNRNPVSPLSKHKFILSQSITSKKNSMITESPTKNLVKNSFLSTKNSFRPQISLFKETISSKLSKPGKNLETITKEEYTGSYTQGMKDGYGEIKYKNGD